VPSSYILHADDARTSLEPGGTRARRIAPPMRSLRVTQRQALSTRSSDRKKSHLFLAWMVLKSVCIGWW